MHTCEIKQKQNTETILKRFRQCFSQSPTTTHATDDDVITDKPRSLLFCFSVFVSHVNTLKQNWNKTISLKQNIVLRLFYFSYNHGIRRREKWTTTTIPKANTALNLGITKARSALPDGVQGRQQFSLLARLLLACHVGDNRQNKTNLQIK